MSDKETKKENMDFEREWERVRLCAKLIREGDARIVVRKRKDGSIYRYTKLK